MQNIPGNSSSIESMNCYQRKRFRKRDLDEKKRDLSMKILEQNNKKENVPQSNRTGIKEDVNGVFRY